MADASHAYWAHVRARALLHGEEDSRAEQNLETPEVNQRLQTLNAFVFFLHLLLQTRPIDCATAVKRLETLKSRHTREDGGTLAPSVRK